MKKKILIIGISFLLISSFAFADMVVDSNGNVGINITMPLSELEVNGTISGTAFVGNGSGLTGVGDITGVTAGAGLSGSGTSGEVTLSIPTDGISTSMITDLSVTDAKLQDGAALAEIADNDGAGSGLDADLLDGQQASDIISAASDEVRTEISSCPYPINSSGSYYLSGNMSSDLTCITVTRDNVTIDLMGFMISGGGLGTNGHGIYINNQDNVEIKNGTIRNFGLAGIYIPNGTNHRISNIRAIDNSSIGIWLDSSNNVVANCVANNNYTGIAVGPGSIVTGNIATNNTISGIVTDSGALVKNNIARSNGSGIDTFTGSLLKDNIATDNQGNGIHPGANNLIYGNTAYDNNQSGGGSLNITACATCTFGTNHAP